MSSKELGFERLKMLYVIVCRAKEGDMKEVGKAKGVSRKEREGIWLLYTHLIGASLLVCMFTLTVPGSVKAAVFNVAAGDVYGPNGLVAAIKAANGTAEADDIVLQPGTYTLTRVDNDTVGPNGLPSIRRGISILVDGGTAVIERDASAPPFRIFHVGPGGVTLVDLVIGGGKVEERVGERGAGGGIFNLGSLVLINCTVTGNMAFKGGGIFNDGFGFLSLSFSTVSSNIAREGGGGIFNEGGLLILSSSIRGSRTSIFGGGGINNVGSTVLENSTVSDNCGGGGGGTGGGGILNRFGGRLTITNSTISGNKMEVDGGGIRNQGTLDLNNVTITNNFADARCDGSRQSGVGDGGGILNDGMVNLKNTIIAGNFDRGEGDGISPDCDGALTSQGFNLLGDPTGCSGLTNGIKGDQVGTHGSPINPLLDPLKDNGGPSETHALLSGSPAIDAGNPAAPGSGGNACERSDQRFFRRPIDGPDADSIATCDIGAFEFGMCIVNDLLSKPTKSNRTTSNDPSGCPTGFVGKFTFNARFTNMGSASLTDLVVEVETLTNGNLLQNSDGGPGGVGARLTVPNRGGFQDGVLSPGESVNVTFTICLKNKKRFEFFVDVLGVVE